MYKIKEYNIYKLKVGDKYSTCPICSNNRRKKHQKCMMLDWETGIGTCQHCGEVIQLHSYKKRYAEKVNYKKPIPNKPSIKIDYIDEDLVLQTLRNYSRNNFVQFLIKVFGTETAKAIVNTYQIGTSKQFGNSTVFWQKDSRNKIRTGKIIAYNINGKRIKEPYNKVLWAHKLLGQEKYNLKQCLYGQHLINQNKPIFIVEGEKTASICFGFYPQYTWLSVGGKNNFNIRLLSALKGKEISVFPDSDAYHLWLDKGQEISKVLNMKIHISDLLENTASLSEKQEGYDIADYLVKHSLSQKQNSISKKRVNKCTHISEILDEFINTFGQRQPKIKPK
jgi:hypothetical protein